MIRERYYNKGMELEEYKTYVKQGRKKERENGDFSYHSPSNYGILFIIGARAAARPGKIQRTIN